MPSHKADESFIFPSDVPWPHLPPALLFGLQNYWLQWKTPEYKLSEIFFKDLKF